MQDIRAVSNITYNCSPTEYKLYKKTPFFREKVGISGRENPLTILTCIRYSMNNSISQRNVMTETVAEAAKSKASRGRCKPGESSPSVKITPEQRPEIQ